MVDLNVIYPMEDRRGTSQETIQAIKHNQDFRETTDSQHFLETLFVRLYRFVF